MAMNLENNLINAHSEYVSIAESKAEYTAHYDALRKEIYGQWKGHEALGKLVNGYTLGGGYGDKLKVGMPDEFDLVIHLQFPENDKVIVTPDRARPGNVILDMTKVMQVIANQEHNKAVFQLLQKIVNHKQQLLEDKLQSMLQGLMTQALIKMGNKIEVNGVISPLKYRRCGPAHTIEVKGRYVYSVDFVPAIRLSPAQSVLAPEQRRHFGDTESWDAIPKPIKPPQPENVSFRASYYDAEKKLIYSKNNLKNAIRLLKQYRNTKSNMSNLKSYFIKTLFLWEVTKQNASYWQKPNSELLIDMLTKLADVLSQSSAKGKGKLLFFWDPKLDMIADLDNNQRGDLFNCVIGAQSDFRRADGNLTDDIKNRVHNTFTNGVKDKGLENKPLNGQVNKTKEKSPPVAKPKPTPNEPKKKAPVQTENKPKEKAELKTNEPKKSGEVQNGAKPKVKADPVQVKPNPKPNEQQKAAKPNPNQNQPKVAEVVTPPTAQPNQPKKAQPETKPNPNGNATKAKGNGQPNVQPQPKAKGNGQPNVQPQPKAKGNVQPNPQPQPKPNGNGQPNPQPQPKAKLNQNGASKPQPETSPKKDESSCLLN